MIPKAVLIHKENIDKLDFKSKNKTICPLEVTIKGIKRQATNWEKISDKRVISKICKELLKFNNKEATQLENAQKI